MCTVTKIKPKLCIATEDIICYKRVNIEKYNWFKKILKRTIYCIKSDIKEFIYKINKIEYSELDEFKKLPFGEYQSGKGFYSYDTPIGCNVKCIIPKGTSYYLAKDMYDGRYIYTSDRIKIIENLLYE